jgi:peptide subunit release factor 1 (eRF1)
MITREQINELAQFEDQASCALSFYFQPATPRNKAHKEDAILAKDLAREALRQIETNGKNESARADLDRIVRLSQELRGNGAHAKVVFACGAQKFWREYDLPAQLSGTQLVVDRHFHLKPLARLLGAFPNLGILLVDRHRARLFDLRLGELTEREGFFHPLTRRGRGDGFAGYDGGHAQRRVEDEALHHYKFVADFVKDALDKGMFEKWILGCQETHWPQIETQLHSYASQKLLGRFSAEVARASLDGIRSQAERIFAESQERRCSEILHETISQARANGRGVTGLRRVLNSMEAGEVQTLFVGQNYHSQAVECAGCGHLDAHLVSFCPVCGRETRQVVDVSDAILPWVIRRNIELFYVKDDAEFDKVGNIAALLRFRSEQNKNVRSISEAPLNPSYSRKEGMVGRYRGLASG